MTNSKPSTTSPESSGEENVAAPVSHSLIKKGGPDGILLSAYKKVEKKLDGVLKLHLSNVIDCAMKVEVDDSAKLLFKDWLAALAAESVYLEFQLGASEKPILVRVSRTFLSASVDCFFGGQFDGEAHSSGDLKQSEITMINRLAGAIAAGLSDAWSMLFDSPVRYSRYFQDKDDIELDLDDENVLVSATSVHLSGHKIAAMDVIQTLDGLIAIEPQLNRPHHRETNEVDPVWKANLKDSVEQIYMPVRSVLARPTMQLSELSRLAVGDILPVAPTDNVPLIVGDRVFAHGSIGEQNGGVAFKIKQFL
ncbi:FliM/FliN family flagellar motor switch protein [uncultured Parasphingorhabdus sp.]|uniref:FliM/FliN family flagellar motor switch protein n=1 Tax=uncultured Parasphingorhabdus sp. TaxID=2709694 RepID=UPI0030DBFCA2|tara:strand:+ start:13318 stop:14241 length:924 start_codon:yes stop_codon:yes gene_type:complete